MSNSHLKSLSVSKEKHHFSKQNEKKQNKLVIVSTGPTSSWNFILIILNLKNVLVWNDLWPSFYLFISVKNNSQGIPHSRKTKKQFLLLSIVTLKKL